MVLEIAELHRLGLLPTKRHSAVVALYDLEVLHPAGSSPCRYQQEDWLAHFQAHTFSTLIKSLGVDAKMVQELLRHASFKTTMDGYTQAFEPPRRQALGEGSWPFSPPLGSTLDIDRIIHYHMVVDKLDTTFAALSDPTRRAMVERLSHGPASVRGLTEPFALSQQMISKHIAYLVRARIVIKTKRGRESVCTLRPEAIKTVSDWAISYRRFWEESFDKLDLVVNQMKKAEVRDDKEHG